MVYITDIFIKSVGKISILRSHISRSTPASLLMYRTCRYSNTDSRLHLNMSKRRISNTDSRLHHHMSERRNSNTDSRLHLHISERRNSNTDFRLHLNMSERRISNTRARGLIYLN